MIENDRQYYQIRLRIAELQWNRYRHRYESAFDPEGVLGPRLRGVYESSLLSQIGELQAEVREYVGRRLAALGERLSPADREFFADLLHLPMEKELEGILEGKGEGTRGRV